MNQYVAVSPVGEKQSSSQLHICKNINHFRLYSISGALLKRRLTFVYTCCNYLIVSYVINQN